MSPATIINGALLSQVLLGVVMFIAAWIMHSHQPRTAMFRDEPVRSDYSWLILILLLVSLAALVFTSSSSESWMALFKGTSFSGVPDSIALLVVFAINIVITTILVANTGGSVDSPFQPIFFLIPTLALLLFESSARVIGYSVLVSIAFVALLIFARPLHESQRRGARKAYGFVSVASLFLAVLIGLLTRICPEGMC